MVRKIILLTVGTLFLVSFESSFAEEKVYSVKGVIQSIDTETYKRAIIDHEEIPGYMRQMIMPFKAKNPKEFQNLSPGDVVTFDYLVTQEESWVRKVKKTGEKGPVKEIAQDMDKPAPLLSEGDVLPDYEFQDETGKTVSLKDYRGKPVALTFVFSRCPVPDYCPKMMRSFNEVREALDEDPEALDKYHLLTISFDTWNDTPEVMKAWGAAYGHQAGQPWSLLSSNNCCTIFKIGANVGLKFGEVQGSYQHNLRTVILTPSGVIQRIFTDETWTKEEVIKELKKAATNL